MTKPIFVHNGWSFLHSLCMYEAVAAKGKCQTAALLEMGKYFPFHVFDEGCGGDSRRYERAAGNSLVCLGALPPSACVPLLNTAVLQCVMYNSPVRERVKGLLATVWLLANDVHENKC